MTVSAKDLKILMIGNSFSICVGNNLPQLVAHEKKHTLDITSAYIGGCTLKTHAANLRLAEQDPKFSPYLINRWYSNDLRKKGKRYGNVNNLLKNNKYDIITIQQGSLESWDYKFYQPHADELISYIKKYNPQAEIVIQQTWAYRSDSLWLQNMGMTQSEMSQNVIKAYIIFAKHTNFRLIPTGRAVEIARTSPLYQYIIPTKEQLAEFVSPDLPPRANDVVGRHFWTKTADSFSLNSDTIHLNEHGEYMQACVWYSFLFNEDAKKINYEPRLLSPENCRILRNAAAQAIAEYK